MEVEEASPVPLVQLTVDVLSTIKQAQAQNGLKHGDYMRYRCGPLAAAIESALIALCVGRDCGAGGWLLRLGAAGTGRSRGGGVRVLWIATACRQLLGAHQRCLVIQRIAAL